MSKIDEVRSAMMAAMKAKDKERKDALSALLSALKNKAIDKRADLTEEEEVQVILKEIKQTKETLEMTPSDRTDIIRECEMRLAVLEEYAPKMMDEEEINLSCLEFDTLLYLIRNMDLVLSKEQIYEAVWKHETDDYINAVTCVIYKLRQKIEPDPSHPKYLQTVRGVGYRFVIPEE